MKDNMSLVYGLGSKARTRFFNLTDEDYLSPLNNQWKLSVPLITSISILTDDNKTLFSIYVGKELSLKNYNNYYIEKYDLDVEELEKLKDDGYERICLLNYKKYDLIMVGLEKNDRVVPDYYALQRSLGNLEDLLDGI